MHCSVFEFYVYIQYNWIKCWTINESCDCKHPFNILEFQSILHFIPLVFLNFTVNKTKTGHFGSKMWTHHDPVKAKKSAVYSKQVKKKILYIFYLTSLQTGGYL